MEVVPVTEENTFYRSIVTPIKPIKCFQFLKDNMNIDDIEASSTKAYKSYLIEALKENPLQLETEDDQWKSDRDIVIVSVSHNGNTLQYASKDLRNDKEVVKIAIETNFTALQYASDDIRDDKQILLIAVNVHGNSLRYGSERLKSDKEVVLKAIKNNPYSIQYVSDVLYYDPDVYKLFQEEIISRLKLEFQDVIKTIIIGNYDCYHNLTHHGIIDVTDEDINSLQYPLKYVQHYNLRIYLSSNRDVEKEKRILLDEIIPQIKDFAADYGIDVMIIDQYSNNNANILDHLTWIDSKHEINRCRHSSSGLFFLSLQSDKYGFRPLPKYIPIDVYEERYESFPKKQCNRCIKKSKEKKQRLECKRCSKADIQLLADQWYTIDKNNIPPRYVLKSLIDINDSNYYDEVLPKLREAFQGLVFAEDDYNDEEPEELDLIFHQIKDMMKKELKNDLAINDEIDGIMNRIDKINPIENELSIHEFLKPKVLKSLNFIITSDKVIMGSKLKKRVKNLIEMIEKMIVEPDDEGNDVIINRSINEYEVKVAMANDFDISRCQWMSRIFSYPTSNNTIEERKSNIDFLLGETTSNNKNTATVTAITATSNNKYKDYNDSDDASLKLRLDNFKAHMLSKFRFESNMIKIKVPIDAYINDKNYINGKEYFSEWKKKMTNLLRKEVDRLIIKKLQWYNDGYGIHENGDDVDEILHHCKLAYSKSHDFLGRDEIISQVMNMLIDEKKSDLNVVESSSSSIDHVSSDCNVNEDNHDNDDSNEDIRDYDKNSLECITFVLVGSSGSGKSALMSKISSLCFHHHHRIGSSIPIIIRFCCTSSYSNNGLDLIKSINNQMRLAHKLPTCRLSDIYEEAVSEFQLLLSQYSVFLFIDGLDMLTNDNNEVSHFSFLRGCRLHSESRIIISLSGINSTNKKVVIESIVSVETACVEAIVDDTNNANDFTDTETNTNSTETTTPDDPVVNTSSAKDNQKSDEEVDIRESYKETDKCYCHLLLKRQNVKQLIVSNFSDYDDGTSDSIKILHSSLEKKGRSLTTEQWNYVMQQVAIEPTALYVRIIVPFLETWSSYDTDVKLTATVKDLVLEIIQGLEDTYGRELVRAMLGYITFSLQGLTLIHLQDLLSLNDDVTDKFFKSMNNDNKLQIPMNTILRVKNTLEEHLLVTEKKEGKIVWSQFQFKQIAYERYSEDNQEEKIYRTIMGIYFGDIVDPAVRESRCISSQPLVFGKIPVWFPGTILNRSRLVEAVHQMLQGESFLIFKAYKEIIRPDVICGLIKCGEGFNLISYFSKLKQVLQTCSAKLMFKYKFMVTESAIDYNDMLLHIDNYMAWLEREMTTMMSNPSAEIITTSTSGQPLISKARLEVEKFIKSTRVSFFEIDASSNYWIRGKSAGGKSAFDIPRLIIRSHTSGIRCVACTKDGVKLASSSGLTYGSIDNSIRIFDTKSGDLLLHLQGHTDAVNSIAFHPDGTKLISGSNDKTLRIFDTTTGAEILMKVLPHSIHSVAIHPDGKHIATACDKYIIILSIETLFETIEIIDSEIDNNVEIEVDNLDNESIGESITTVGSSSVVESLMGHDNNNDNDDEIEIESRKQPPPVTIIEKLELVEVKRLMGHKKSIASIVYSHDGNLILSGSYDNSMIIWKSDTIITLQGHTDRINCVAFSNDDTLIVSGSKDHCVRVWNTIEGIEIMKLEGHSDSVTSVAFTQGKTFIISGSVDKTIRKWDAANGKELIKWDGHTGIISSILIREDLGTIISGSSDCSMRLWELEEESASAKSQRHISSITSLIVSNDGYHIVSGSRDSTIRIWSADTGEGLKVLLGHTDDVTALAYNYSGSRLASGSGGSDNTIFLWDPIEGDWLVVLKGHTADVVSLHFSPDGNRIVSRSKDRSIRLFDTETGDGIELVGHTGWVTSIAFTPDSSRLGSGSEDKTIIVWNSTTGEKVTVIEGSLSAVLCLSFNLHGSQIVSGSGGVDKSIRIWQAYTGVELKKIRGHACDVTDISFSNDGSRIVSVSDHDKCIKIWDAVTAADLTPVAIKSLSISESYKFEKNYSSSFICRFSKSLYGSRIISAIGGKKIGVYDALSCTKILDFDATSDVTRVVLINDGKRIVSAGKDGNLTIWDTTVYT